MKILRSAILSLALVLPSMVLALGPVNINTASAEAIAEAIKGVGMQKASAIVAYRDAHGPFKSVDELAAIKGIGAKTLEQNRAKLTTE
ncbi:MAG: helix-hairpin-helix domain-containing protein [Gammaproteobacteria bacterium]|nr:helix-hairpin-helix domain-containing protein [Gammaproteobacteria bacterium]